MSCWETLGIEPTSNKRDIKRAYVKLLKKNNPEDDAEAFQKIREAHDEATKLADFIDLAKKEQSSNIEQTIEVPSHSGDIEEPFSISIEIEPLYRNEEQNEEKNEEQNDERNREKSSESSHQQPIDEATRVHTEQSEKIKAAIAEIKPLIETDQKKAIALCKLYINDEYFQAIDVRYRFEGELLRSIISLSNFPKYFIEFIESEFDWDIDLHRRPFYITNHFDRHYHYAEAYALILRRYLSDKVRQQVKENYVLADLRTPLNDHVEAIVFTSFDENRFRIFDSSPDHKETLRKIYRYIKAKKFDEIGLSPLAPEVEAWILNSKNIDYFTQTIDIPSPTNKKSNSNFWVLFVIFVLAINIFNYIGNSKPDTPVPIKQEAIERYKAKLKENELPIYLRPPKANTQDVTHSPSDEKNSEKTETIIQESNQAPPKRNAESEDNIQKTNTNKSEMQFSNGLYTGEIRKGLPDGEGNIQYDNGDRFTGLFKNGVRDKGFYEWKDGKTFEGDFINDQPGNYGKWTYNGGASFIGEKKDGEAKKGTYTFPSGNVFTGQFIDGFAKGVGTWKYTNGDIKEVYQVNDSMSVAKLTSPNGYVYEGEWKNDLYHGQGNEYFNSGETFSGQFEEGKRVYGTYRWNRNTTEAFKTSAASHQSTMGKCFTSPRLSYTGEWQNNLPNGKGSETFANQDFFQGKYKAGERISGTYTWADGTRYEGENFSWTLKSGKFTFPNGDIFIGEMMADKKVQGELYFKSSGDIYSGEFKHNEITGQGRYQKGNKVYIGQFERGLLEGKGELIDENQWHYAGNFKQGSRHGKFLVTNPDGTQFKTRFKSDERIRKLKRI